MKIWPFDYAAEASNGLYISPSDLKKAIEPFEKIRKTVGDSMDIMVELHSLWTPRPAKQIFKALEPFDPFWFEDPIKMNDFDSLAALAASTDVPICASETLATRPIFRDLMAKRATGVVMLDLSWVGGLSESRKIAAMAEAHQLPIAPHDCSGPVVFAASCHLSLNATNALIQESVRAFYTGWYKELVTTLPRIEEGYIYPTDSPGLGTALLPDIVKRKDAHIQRSGST